jgi:hypothetical protein
MALTVVHVSKYLCDTRNRKESSGWEKITSTCDEHGLDETLTQVTVLVSVRVSVRVSVSVSVRARGAFLLVCVHCFPQVKGTYMYT